MLIGSLILIAVLLASVAVCLNGVRDAIDRMSSQLTERLDELCESNKAKGESIRQEEETTNVPR